MYDNVYLIGDLHGKWRPIWNFLERQPHLKDTTAQDNVMICLGDFGGNFFFDHRDRNFKKKICKYPFTYFVIRGNHEERPSICAEKDLDNWQAEDFFSAPVYVEKAFPQIKYAIDCVAYYNIQGYKTLIIPGAYSVDKYYRLQNGWSWFENEQLTQKEMNRGLELIEKNNWQADLVLSHTCPIQFEPTDLFLSVIDQSMVDKTMERYLGQIERQLDYKTWCWGHYHSFREYNENFPKQIMFSDGKECINLSDVMNNKPLTTY